MDRLDQVMAEVDRLRSGMLNMRADLMAYRIFVSASIIAMTPDARNALRHNVQLMGEQAMAAGLATSRSADDSSIRALEAALARLNSMLESLPAS